MNIILDCMSGDNAPREIIIGGFEGKKRYGVSLTLVGDTSVIESVIAEKKFDMNDVTVLHAEGPHITMENAPGDVIKDEYARSSMAVSLDALKNGEGDAVVSAGNTGALLTGATLKIRRIKGIRRPALGAILPFKKPALLVDAGAQTDCTPENLVLFAEMGNLFMKSVYHVDNPKIALINNGAEAHKGTALQKETYALLKENKRLNFVGNVEGRELFDGENDVLVCDGFTGNIVLKTCEGAGKLVKQSVKNIFYHNTLTKIGGLFCKSGISALKKSMSYDEYGGAPFLGVARPVIKAHGSANALSISYCIGQAKAYASSGMIDTIAALAEQPSVNTTNEESQ